MNTWMTSMMSTLKDTFARAEAIRARYHALEQRLHDTPWSVEEDALAFLTDAALVGRMTMATAGRWPTSTDALPAKLAECVWWLAVLARRQDIDLDAAVDAFLADKERTLP